VHIQIKEKGEKVNSVTEFNQGLARGLMLAIAMLQDDLHYFQMLNQIENGLPLTPLHTAAYNEILAAKLCLERAHRLLITESIADSPINLPVNDVRFFVDEARINEIEMWRGNRPCGG
jgi:hypothetical protein